MCGEPTFECGSLWGGLHLSVGAYVETTFEGECVGNLHLSVGVYWEAYL